MSEEEKLQLENECLLKYSKAQMIQKYIDELEENCTLSDLWCKSQEENKRLNNIINELEKKLLEWHEYWEYDDEYNWQYKDTYDYLQELKGSNEPSFEEMVGFVENVCKDIKSQPTLHEELEEERKTIAKIVGDFKEVNK